MIWLKLLWFYLLLSGIFYLMSGKSFPSMILSIALYVTWHISLHFLKKIVP